MNGRRGRGLYEIRNAQDRHARGPNGRRLCTWCRQEVENARRKWCGQACVDAYLAQASQAGLRRAVWNRDRGVCARCRFDTGWLTDAVKESRSAGDSVALLLLRMCGYRRIGDALWEADHIVPVSEGGAHDLANARTLLSALPRLGDGRPPRAAGAGAP